MRCKGLPWQRLGGAAHDAFGRHVITRRDSMSSANLSELSLPDRFIPGEAPAGACAGGGWPWRRTHCAAPRCGHARVAGVGAKPHYLFQLCVSCGGDWQRLAQAGSSWTTTHLRSMWWPEPDSRIEVRHLVAQQLLSPCSSEHFNTYCSVLTSVALPLTRCGGWRQRAQHFSCCLCAATQMLLWC